MVNVARDRNYSHAGHSDVDQFFVIFALAGFAVSLLVSSLLFKFLSGLFFFFAK